jgi:hypothetical protein
MDAATMYSRSIGIFYLVFIWIWSISASFIQQNTTTFSSLLKVKGITREVSCFFRSLKNLQILYSPPPSKTLSYVTRWIKSAFT